MKRLLTQTLRLISAFVTMFVFLIQSPGVSALIPFTSKDANKIYNQQDFRDEESDPQGTANCELNAAPVLGTAQPPAPVYFVGDSIGTVVAPELEATFSTGGWTFKSSSLSSRRLAGTPPSPDGLGQADSDKDYIATAKVIIIELGTNSGGFTVANVNTMIDKLRGFAPTASIYWVDTAVVGKDTTTALALDKVNGIIYSQAPASVKNYSVISWNKRVFGAAANPLKMEGQPDTEVFLRTDDSLNVHPTAGGIKAMTELIASTVTGGSAVTGDQIVLGNCACAAGNSSLPGQDNREKIFFNLLSRGLTPVQAAGMMGNIQSESAGTWDPRIVEFGWPNSRGEISQAGQPSSFDDNVPPDNPPKGQPGYGIIQWTAGRKQPLRDLAVERGVPASNLLLQLDNLWRELSTVPQYLNQVLTPIQASSDIAFIADTFMRHFEVPGGNLTTLSQQRTQNAIKILTELGSLTAPPPGGADLGCTGGNGTPAPIISGDTTDIPCAAGTDAGIADGYTKGNLVKIRLCKVQGLTVNSQISKNIDDLINASVAAGLDIITGAGSFRTMAAQTQEFINRCGASYPKTTPWQKPPCIGAPLARPGWSNHQMGFAIDFTCNNGGGIPQGYSLAKSNPCWMWLDTHARTYGMFEWGWDAARGTGNRTAPNYEGWHWSVDGN